VAKTEWRFAAAYYLGKEEKKPAVTATNTRWVDRHDPDGGVEWGRSQL